MIWSAKAMSIFNLKIKMPVYMLIVILFSSEAFSATRFYLPSSGTPEVSPAFMAAWNTPIPADIDRVCLVPVRTNTPMVNKNFITSGGAKYNVNRMYVSCPIGPGIISGTVKGQLRGLAAATGHTMAIGIKVVSNDGTIVRTPDLLSVINETNNLNITTLESRYAPTLRSLTPVAAQNGDRIVIEIGTQKGAGPSNATQSFGDNSSIDLPENETEQQPYNPWIEFSQDIFVKGKNKVKIMTSH